MKFTTMALAAVLTLSASQSYAWDDDGSISGSEGNDSLGAAGGNHNDTLGTGDSYGSGGWDIAGPVANDNRRNGWGPQVNPNLSFPSFPFGSGIFGGVPGKPANQNGYAVDTGVYSEFGFSGGGFGGNSLSNDPGGTGGQD